MKRAVRGDRLARPAIVLLALALDLWWGDPPNRFHPVVWMGALIGRLSRTETPVAHWRRRFLRGLLVGLGGGAGVGLLGMWAERLLACAPWPLSWLLQAVLLKSTLACHGLVAAAREVEGALAAGNLPEARRLLAWHLVSRDTAALDGADVAAAVIESIAENTSDAVVAPICAYAAGGLGAALAYRYANTADAMLGYRDAEREWLGKAPARLDDLFNLVPARVTACLLLLAAWLRREDWRAAWRVWRRDAGKTASPNAGHPMSAMAGALRVELAKPGHYVLGAGYARPAPHDITRAIRLLHMASGIIGGCAALLCLGRWRAIKAPCLHGRQGTPCFGEGLLGEARRLRRHYGRHEHNMDRFF